MEREAQQHEARQVAQTLETAHDADVAEALNAIDHAAAARVLAALPFDLAVRVLDEPELDHRAHLFEHLPDRQGGALMTRCRPTSRPSSSAACRPGIASGSCPASTPAPARPRSAAAAVLRPTPRAA